MTEAVLTFDGPIERRFARLSLSRNNGPGRSLQAPAGHGTVTKLRPPLGQLTPGRYRLRWSVVSRDGHQIQGSIRFTLRGR